MNSRFDNLTIDNKVHLQNISQKSSLHSQSLFFDYMSLSQGKVLRNGKTIELPLEMNAPEESNRAQSNSNDSDTNDSSDISSQLSEMKENYERKINELHLEFSQLKDLMMAVIDKTNNDSRPSSSQGPSKQPQPGRDTETGRTRGNIKHDDAPITSMIIKIMKNVSSTTKNEKHEFDKFAAK